MTITKISAAAKRRGVYIWILLVLCILLVAASYTWFSITRRPRVSDMEMYINSPTGLELAGSYDSTEWVQQLDFVDLVDEVSDLKPVTWSTLSQCFYTEKRTSLVRVYCSELVSDGEAGIHVYGNGSENSQLTALIVENSKIQAAAIGICGNGSHNSYGTDIQVRNSTVSGKWAGIYQPQQKSKLSVFGNSTVEGITALAIKGGTVTVLDSTVQSTAESTTNGLIKNPTDTQLSKNGFVDTGAAVYVEANYNWADSIRVKINNSTVSSAVNTPVLVLGPQKDKVVLTQVDVKQ